MTNFVLRSKSILHSKTVQCNETINRNAKSSQINRKVAKCHGSSRRHRDALHYWNSITPPPAHSITLLYESQGRATGPCFRAVLQGRATGRCYRAMLLAAPATEPCYRPMLKRRATSPCYRAVPQAHATGSCYSPCYSRTSALCSTAALQSCATA